MSGLEVIKLRNNQPILLVEVSILEVFEQPRIILAQLLDLLRQQPQIFFERLPLQHQQLAVISPSLPLQEFLPILHSLLHVYVSALQIIIPTINTNIYLIDYFFRSNNNVFFSWNMCYLCSSLTTRPCVIASTELG